MTNRDGWSRADRILYIAGILKNRLELTNSGHGIMIYHVKVAVEAGVPFHMIEDEARLTTLWSSFTTRLLDLAGE